MKSPGNNPPGQKTTQPAVQSDDLVARNEEKIITRAKAPFKGKQFKTLADQDAYIRGMLSQ